MAETDGRTAEVTPERKLGQRLHSFTNTVSGRYYQRTEKPFGIALSEWRVLRSTVLTPGISQSEIAAAEGLNVMNVSRAAAALRRKGLIESRPDPDDGRRSLLLPTELGSELSVDLAAREHLMYEHAFSTLGRDELALLDELMERVNAVIRDVEPPDPPPASQDWAKAIADFTED